MEKDSLKKVVKMMTYLETHLEKDNEESLKNKFKEDYQLFARYCLGGENPYAIDKVAYISLTQKGVRKLYELRSILAKERLSWLTSVGTATLALFSLIQILLFISQ